MAAAAAGTTERQVKLFEHRSNDCFCVALSCRDDTAYSFSVALTFNRLSATLDAANFFPLRLLGVLQCMSCYVTWKST